MNVNYELCHEAYKFLREKLLKTPLIKNEYLSNKYEANIYLKLENLQPVGSFKVRGALFKIKNLKESEKKNGVLAVSAGNHAQGVAYASKMFGVKAKIIMPQGSPMIKVKNTQNLGAEVILHGDNIDEGFEYAKEVIEKTGATFVHPFHDPYIIAGQSTVAFEILEDLPNADYAFTGIGGGGLALGSSLVFNHDSKVRVIGAQACGANSMVESIKNKTLIKKETASTFADGIKVKNANPEMYELLKENLFDSVDVSDEKIAKSILILMEQARVIAEGAGAISLASFDEYYKTHASELKNRNVVLVVSGGNIDINLIDRIIDRGLIESKRRVKFNILLNDRPYELHRLTDVIGKEGANILQVIHDREMPNLDMQKTGVLLTIETKGEAHALQIEKRIIENGFEFSKIC